ncbi:EamA family transporter [Roseomonas sp. 18066]|uniref:EamA family transporter n=1 Tax=Roseomonas sp. 18066 TaxID=2681412 RepID=UPI00135A6802|nr:EamA family transporter [Roseomonas sp. 18066]
MQHPPAARIAQAAAIGFVPLWSSGILLGALALRHGPPFAVTGLRFAAAALVLAGLAALRRQPWPRGAALLHAGMVGLLLQGAHYAGIYAGMAAGMQAGVAALVVGLIPVATAAGAALALGERFTRARALAVALGVAAVLLVAGSRLGLGDSGATLPLAALALAGGAGGALWQKRFGGGGAGLPAAAVQLATGALVMALCWLALEQGRARPIDGGAAEFQAAFAWTVLANSVGGTLLLLWLLARGAAGRVTGLFFLVPPCTALAAVPLLGEPLRLPLLGGILLGGLAVLLLSREAPAAGR